MTNKLTIEKATLDDCHILALMNRQLIDENEQTNQMTVFELEDRMHDWLDNGTFIGFLFMLYDEVIGFALINPTEMWVRHFYICPNYRRQGFGKKAVELLFDVLGTEEIGLSCLTTNAAGLAFWQSFEHEAFSIKFNIRRAKGAD